MLVVRHRQYASRATIVMKISAIEAFDIDLPDEMGVGLLVNVHCADNTASESAFTTKARELLRIHLRDHHKRSAVVCWHHPENTNRRIWIHEDGETKRCDH